MLTLGARESIELSYSGNNVTVRKPPKQQSKMALTFTTTTTAGDHEGGESDRREALLFDSILSQSEENEVRKMLEIEGETMGSVLPFTSTQMGGTHVKRPSLYMSPIMDRDFQNPSCSQLRDGSQLNLLLGNNRFASLEDEMNLRNEGNTSGLEVSSPGMKINTDNQAHNNDNINTAGEALHDPVLPPGLGEGGQGPRADSNDVVGENGDAAKSENAGRSNGDEADSEGSINDVGTAEDLKIGGMDGIADRLVKVDKILGDMGNRSTLLTGLVSGLRESLEFSQKEIDTLKLENRELRQKVADLETEESRSAYQINKLDEKVDRVDTQTRRKNLILEGIAEVDGKEDVGKTIWRLFDQLNVSTGMEFDACYRQGTFNANRTRPIVISFQRQVDRDMVYASRMNLRKTVSYKQVWVNEDLGKTSKKTRNLIRLIAKKAQAEGIDCRSGKYMLQVNREKFDGSKLDELPPPLHPSNIKQFNLDKDTVVYQSEHAPFSNMFPVAIVVGQYRFVSLEQAFQFFKAKTMNKLLAATKIYLSRNQIEIKQMGDELGQSELWDTKKYDIMYVCLKRKFEQNPELKEMLLKTGTCELVEATPNRLWGCGATLSSNLLQRHEWPGENRQGKTLMIVREELRQRTLKD